MWCGVMLWCALVVVRLLWVLLPQTGYIHPDEFFQTTEVAAGDIFGLDVLRTWEFTDPAPLRSIVPVYAVCGLPLLALKLASLVLGPGVVCAYSLLVAARLAVTLLSLGVDYCIYRLAELCEGDDSVNEKDETEDKIHEIDFKIRGALFQFDDQNVGPQASCGLQGVKQVGQSSGRAVGLTRGHRALLVIATSYVTLVYHTRTFSNTTESFLFAAFLFICMRRGSVTRDNEIKINRHGVNHAEAKIYVILRSVWRFCCFVFIGRLFRTLFALMFRRSSGSQSFTKSGEHPVIRYKGNQCVCLCDTMSCGVVSGGMKSCQCGRDLPQGKITFRDVEQVEVNAQTVEGANDELQASESVVQTSSNISQAHLTEGSNYSKQSLSEGSDVPSAGSDSVASLTENKLTNNRGEILEANVRESDQILTKENLNQSRNDDSQGEGKEVDCLGVNLDDKPSQDNSLASSNDCEILRDNIKAESAEVQYSESPDSATHLSDNVSDLQSSSGGTDDRFLPGNLSVKSSVDDLDMAASINHSDLDPIQVPHFVPNLQDPNATFNEQSFNDSKFFQTPRFREKSPTVSSLVRCKSDAFMLSLLLSLGTFNRPTFVLFAFIPYLHWIVKDFIGSWSTPKSIWRAAHKAILTALYSATFSAAFVLIDSAYYNSDAIAAVFSCVKYTVDAAVAAIFDLFSSGDAMGRALSSLVVTPVNFVLYNLAPHNLATHGLHPRITHFVINAPMLFGPMAVFASIDIFRAIRNVGKCNFSLCRPSKVLLASYAFPLVALSAFPHQEPRFLVPLIAPLVIMYARKIFRWPVAWVVFNVACALFFGCAHQGGVVPVVAYLQRLETETPGLVGDVVFWRTYMPPRHLFVRRLVQADPELHGACNASAQFQAQSDGADAISVDIHIDTALNSTGAGENQTDNNSAFVNTTAISTSLNSTLDNSTLTNSSHDNLPLVNASSTISSADNMSAPLSSSIAIELKSETQAIGSTSLPTPTSRIHDLAGCSTADLAAFLYSLCDNATRPGGFAYLVAPGSLHAHLVASSDRDGSGFRLELERFFFPHISMEYPPTVELEMGECWMVGGKYREVASLALYRVEFEVRAGEGQQGYY